ncbi:hypothetical protein B0T22DRAFT_378968 [Podospora appendiculata]|uniref:Major facilitator superfamily (MFS) profile domain-containing protein n=1 Tax=Podospora appendiculata TaxID=314037 RepID=A0AAE0X8N4_9PEZI|nr:hypothetical protein B0T22DRAFT_378968 [Podospora appendiculata]
MPPPTTTTAIADFLKPLDIDSNTVLELSRELASTFKTLSAESLDQFLPTPISESILRPVAGRDSGRFLAIDILFAWIGDQVAHVVRKACDTFGLCHHDELPMGVTFSFPMKQSSLSEATLMAMGKGFAITSNLDLGGHLLKGYEGHRTVDMPPIRIAAISNDAVSTLVSFVYQYPAQGHQKAAMGVIVGTGCNATIPLKLSSLHASKRPVSISVLPNQDIADVKIAVNTEWSINGSAPPLRKFGLISRWDEQLDKAGEAPGFQPLEYMTAGRYLGELARLIFVDYMTTVLGLASTALPGKLHQRFGLTTTFISHFYPGSPRGDLLEQLEKEFPLEGNAVLTQWTEPQAHALYRIAHAIEVRAAGIVAASTVGLLSCAEEIPPAGGAARTNGDGLVVVKELAVGYTGGCIQYFQSYLADTQRFIDDILELEFAGQTPPVRVTLSPCHDGGITGAGILVPAALGAEKLLRQHTGPMASQLQPPEAASGARPATVAAGTPTVIPHGVGPRRDRNQDRNRDRDSDGDDDNGGEDGSSESEDMDPNEFDLMLSRSLQSGGLAMMEESSEYSMLRNTRRHSRSTSKRRPHRRRGSSEASPYTRRRASDAAAEDTPLLAADANTTGSASSSDTETETHAAKSPFLGGVSPARFWVVFLGIMAAHFVACFDSTIMASSHPVITSYFGSSNSASWLSTAFLLTSTSFQPLVGGLSDAVGRKAPYVITMAIFLVATLWCALAGSMTSFIVARAFCGLGAGGMMTLGSIMISDLVPLMVVSLVVAVVTIPSELGLYGKQKQTLREAMRTFDFAGSALMATSVTLLILGLPIMPMHLVRQSPHMNLIFSNHIAAFLTNAIMFNVPLFFQGVLLTSATTSGLRLVVCSAVASITGTATGFLITSTRRLKWPLVLGTSLLFIGTLCLAGMQRGWPAIVYMLCLVPATAGQGFQFPGTFMAILAVAEQRKQAVVTSTLILWRSLGMVLGVAVSSLVVQNALWYYLELFVSGPDKFAVIELVRQKVEAIKDLDPMYQEQVVQSYEAALRVMFLCCSALALASVLLIVRIKLPRLGESK